MIVCLQCRHENPGEARFCNACGASLAEVCPACRRANPPGSRFCNGCGQALAGAPAAVTPRFGAPESYTPRHLARKIVTSKGSLEGERKQVTVLFADLKGSMELLADRDPEEARRLLDPVLERMMEAVHRYEGTVNQVMGDGIMALFGAPVAHEDHALRAAYAALRMQESIRRYADDVHRTLGVPLHVRVGLNSGEVVVRSIGSDLHMDYTAVGQTTHLAARMEQMAMPGSILVTPETLALCEGYLTVRPLGPRPVKGLTAPVEVYEVVGAGTARSRLHAAAGRGLTSFVGRAGEVEALVKALDRARAGKGQVVAVVGEPGVGKSRLFWEFIRSHRARDWLVVESGSVSYGKATAYLPVVAALRAYFRIDAGDDARAIGEKATEQVLSLDRQLELFLPALRWLLEVPVEAPSWERLDPQQKRQRALEAVRRLLLRESRRQPLLVVFEDLHWIDAETQALLDSLVESLPAARLLLLVNYRTEYRHAWSGRPGYRELQIADLPSESADELLGVLLGGDAGLQPLKRLLIDRTEGNPFFLEESVRALVETQALVGERGAYRLAKAPLTIQIPATAQAIVAARVDRLSPEDKRLLQAASVIGKEVLFSLLEAVAEEDEDGLRGGLGRLQAAEFLYETRLFPDLEYTFRHALTHDVAYGSLLQDRRRSLHARIVEAIETLHRDRIAEHVERLAHHTLRGELWDKAVTYLRQAGARALTRSANREAMTCFEQALGALSHLPENSDRRELAIDLRFDLRNAGFPLGEFERVASSLREAEDLARALGDRRRLGWMSMYMSANLWVTGDWAGARAFGDTARALGESLGDFPLTVAANYYLGAACLTSGDYRRADDLLRRTVASLEGARSRERYGLAGFPAVLARVWLVCALADLGAFGEGVVQGQEAIRIAEAVDHPYSLVLACWALGYLHGVRGEPGLAGGLLERSVALSEEWHLTLLSPMVSAFLGYARALSGRVDEGLPRLRAALSAFESIGIRPFHSLIVLQLGEASARAERVEDARALAERALGSSRERGERGWEAAALRLLGELAARRDPADVETAEGRYREALALADELGMRPLSARCLLGLGTLHRRTGQRQQARGHLASARALLSEMAMRSWLESAEAELAAIG